MPKNWLAIGTDESEVKVYVGTNPTPGIAAMTLMMPTMWVVVATAITPVASMIGVTVAMVVLTMPVVLRIVMPLMILEVSSLVLLSISVCGQPGSMIVVAIFVIVIIGIIVITTRVVPMLSVGRHAQPYQQSKRQTECCADFLHVKNLH